jgi:hypothetical protein
VPNFPRFRALALFGRRPSECVERPSFRRPKTCTEGDIRTAPICGLFNHALAWARPAKLVAMDQLAAMLNAGYRLRRVFDS